MTSPHSCHRWHFTRNCPQTAQTEDVCSRNMCHATRAQFKERKVTYRTEKKDDDRDHSSSFHLLISFSFTRSPLSILFPIIPVICRPDNCPLRFLPSTNLDCRKSSNCNIIVLIRYRPPTSPRGRRKSQGISCC